MRNSTFFILLNVYIVFVLLCVSCETHPMSTERSTNQEIPVELLFEHDGVKVYRFHDYGTAIYYTDCRGRTEWRTTHYCGKMIIHKEHGVETSDE